MKNFRELTNEELQQVNGGFFRCFPNFGATLKTLVDTLVIYPAITIAGFIFGKLGK